MTDTTDNRGLGSDNMDEETKHDIQSKGGQASPQNFANDPDRAAEAGRKGGKAAHEKGTAHEWDSEEAAEAGRKGGSE